MLQSMTACGRGAIDEEGAHFVIEIQSVNRKHLDIQIHLPRTLSFFEAEIRSLIAKKLTRGQVSLRVMASFHHNAPYKVMPNMALAEEIKRAWDEVGAHLGTEGFKPEFLISTTDILSVEFSADHEKRIWNVLKKGLLKALEELNHMKLQEGSALKEDFSCRLVKIEKLLSEIESQSLEAPSKWKEKILERLASFRKEEEIQERIAREVALMLEKIDITEEIVRFRSHIDQFRGYMKKEGVFGKTLEFILQEFGREINTIGSKCQDALILQLVIEVKSEIEKMKEQVQNVE